MTNAARTHRVRTAFTVLAAASLAALFVAQPASAGKTKTSYYTLTADKTTVKYTSTASTGTLVTFTITNCGTSSTCSGTAGSSLTSVDLMLPSGWTAAPTSTVVVTGNDLTVSGKFGVGTPVQVPVNVMPSVTGAGEPQTVTACLPDALTCSYQPTTTNPSLMLPLEFAFNSQLHPELAVNTRYNGNLSVVVTDGESPADPVPGVLVGLRVATGYSGDPVLDNWGTSNAASATSDGSGIAAFDISATQTGGPFALTPYRLPVTSPKIEGTTSAVSSEFTVFQSLKDCSSQGCSTSVTGSQTSLNASSNATSGNLGGSVFLNGSANFPSGLNCPNGGSKISVRPDSVQLQASGDKTAIITWSKAVTLKATDAGTPHWEVCMLAPAPFMNDAGVLTTTVAATFGGLNWYLDTIPICGSSFLVGSNYPCMTLARNAAQEIATITLPAAWAGDPYVH